MDTRNPRRAKRAVFEPSLGEVKRIVTIVLFTAAIGLGYVYGLMKQNVLRKEAEYPDLDNNNSGAEANAEAPTNY